MSDLLIEVEEMANELSKYGSFTIPMLCMLVEEIAKKQDMKLLDLYDKMRTAAEEVVDEIGDVI